MALIIQRKNYVEKSWSLSHALPASPMHLPSFIHPSCKGLLFPQTSKPSSSLSLCTSWPLYAFPKSCHGQLPLLLDSMCNVIFWRRPPLSGQTKASLKLLPAHQPAMYSSYFSYVSVFCSLQKPTWMSPPWNLEFALFFTNLQVQNSVWHITDA